MSFPLLKSIMLTSFLVVAASICSATTVTVGPSGTYATPCTAFPHLADGDTVLVDANGGVPYVEGNCFITKSNLTITGVNGRPVLDATGVAVDKAIWILDGHDIVIDNFEFRKAGRLGSHKSSTNAEAIRAEEGIGTAAGGNVTVQRCYIHDNGTGILTDSADGTNNWFSTSNYFTLQYDEFAFNGNNDSQTHNMYMGDDSNDNTLFTLQYSWSHDSVGGQLVKDREPNSNIYYNLISDLVGKANYLVDIPQGGTTYVVGNSIYKASTSNNQTVMLYGNSGDAPNGFYSSKKDLHFVNNTVLDDPANTFPGDFVSIGCFSGPTSSCALPPVGTGMTVNAVVENNIFLGPSGFTASNQTTAFEEGNVLQTNNATEVAAMHFNNAAELDFRIVSTSSLAYLAGVYPPTDNSGSSDSAALATNEYAIPMNGVSRPTPSGSTMDAGAYHYQTVTAPSLTLSFSSPVTSGSNGTITVSGLPTPAAGQYNYAVFLSNRLNVIPEIPSVASSTGTVTTTFNTSTVTATKVVKVYVYVDGTALTASITVNP